MTTVKFFQRSKIGIEEIMDVKATLKQEKLLSADLSAGLEFAKERLRHMIASKLEGATLLVEGENLVVKIHPRHISSGDLFLVTFVSGHLHLEQHVSVGDVLTRDDIQEHHFIEHHCRDQMNPCYEQARKLLSETSWKNAELRIACNNLSIRFTTEFINASAQFFFVKPMLRFPYSESRKIKDVLQIKCWLEREMPEKTGLLECVIHLLKELSITGQSKNSKPEKVQWILQGDGECLELTSEYLYPTYHLIYVSGNVIKVKN